MTTPGIGHNVGAQKFDELVEAVKVFGADQGKGSDAQVKFGLAVIEASFTGVVDLEDNKHGQGRDDATMLTEHYTRSRSGTTVFDTKKNSVQKTISTTRTCIKVGLWSNGGPSEPLEIIQKAMALRNQARRDPAQAPRLLDGLNFLLNLSRKILKSDTLPTEHEIRGMMFRKDRTLPTAEDLIDGYRKGLLKILTGKAAGETVHDQSPEIKAAEQALGKWLTAKATARGQAPAPKPKRGKGKAQAAPAPAP